MQSVSNKIQHLPAFTLGLVYFVFGLNGFMGFIPTPSYGGAASTFLGGLAASGYFFPFLKGTELVIGMALMSGRYVPLALTILGPVTLNIVLFHAFLAPTTIALPLVLLGLHLYSAWQRRNTYAPLLRSKAPLSKRQARFGREATAS